MLKQLTIFILSFIFFSCTSQQKMSSRIPPIEAKWILVEMQGKQSKLLFPNQIPTIGFSVEQHLFYGKNGCNDYSGNFAMSGKELQFLEPIKVTRMYCETNGQEVEFMKNLNQVDSYTIKDDGLTLILLSKNKTIFLFSKHLD